MKQANLMVLLLISLVFANCQREDTIKMILKSYENGATKDLFKAYHFLYEKNYELNSEEGLKGYKAFKDNWGIIQETNAQNLTYKFGINQFTDLTSEEFSKNYLMTADAMKADFQEKVKFLEEENYFDLHADEEPIKFESFQENTPLSQYNAIDYSALFKPARDQGTCRSCWAFSTLGAVEGNLAKARGRPVDDHLSPQEMVDCDRGNNGCKGGLFNAALTFVYKNGVSKDKEYPYTGVQGQCQAKNTFKQKIKNWMYCHNRTAQRCSFDTVYKILAQGPALVAIDANSIQNYQSGVFTGACKEQNHAVILAGIGQDRQTGQTYWLIRNSWSTRFGESGFIKILAYNQQNSYNACFVGEEAWVPLV